MAGGISRAMGIGGGGPYSITLLAQPSRPNANSATTANFANTRATFEAFFSNRMDFNRTTRVGEIQKGGWRGVPELVVGVVLPVFAFAESNWSALFFFFAVSGLVSIGAMGAIAPRAVRQQITPGE